MPSRGHQRSITSLNIDGGTPANVSGDINLSNRLYDNCRPAQRDNGFCSWGRNVTDRHYWNQAQHVNDVLVRFTGMPRTYGLAVSYRTGN